MNWIQKLKSCFSNDAVYYTRHARTEMEIEETGRIYESEVHEAINKGEVIREYPQDMPYPSALILGETKKGRPLHIVCAYSETDVIAFVITVYQPLPHIWIDYRERRTQ